MTVFSLDSLKPFKFSRWFYLFAFFSLWPDALPPCATSTCTEIPKVLVLGGSAYTDAGSHRHLADVITSWFLVLSVSEVT